MLNDKLRWVVAAGVPAVVAAAALAVMPADRTGSLPTALAADAEFVPDVMLREFIDPGHLAAVPVGPGRVAQPVADVLSGSRIVETLGENGIPEVALRAYQQAAARSASCGLRWTLLAAIGRVESNHGRFGGTELRADGTGTMRIRGVPLDGRANVSLIRDTDGGALDGDPAYDRAVGPMQFIPSTWRLVQADGNGDGRADVFNIFDAALGAAQYLCSGATDLGDPAQAAAAVRRYNNADEYVRVVLNLAAMYESGRIQALPPAIIPDLPRATAGPPAVPWRPSYRQPTRPPATTLTPTRVDPPASPPSRLTPTAPPTSRSSTTNPTTAHPPTRPTPPPPTIQPTTRPTAQEPTGTPSPSTEPTRPGEPATPTPQPPRSSVPTPEPIPPPRSDPTPTDPTPTATNPTPAAPTTQPTTEATTEPSTPPSAEPQDTVAVGWAPAMRTEVVRTLKAASPGPRPADPPTVAPKHPTPSAAPKHPTPSAAAKPTPSVAPKQRTTPSTVPEQAPPSAAAENGTPSPGGGRQS
jgi:hypothetical protein